MKKIISKLMGGILLFSLSMSLTSCEGALDDILGEWSRPTPGDKDVMVKELVNLSAITEDYTAQDGTVLTGTLASEVKISIADGATVTLKDVTINGTSVDDDAHKHAGITCVGSATIILEGENTVKGFYENYPGIYVPDGKTLTIQGTGKLTASSNGYGAGIGGGYEISCGNIVINGGTITAKGGNKAAGIGGGWASCGNIEISGGTVDATGGEYAAGIGGGDQSTCGSITISGGTVDATGAKFAAGIGGGNQNKACGTITITSGVTKVTATTGGNVQSIGKGDQGQDITVNIEAGANVTATGHALSASVVGEIVGSDGKAYAFADKDILPSGTTAEAYIAYKSATAGESRAIALTNDVAFGTSWDAFNSNPGWNSTPNRTSIDNCTWQWPTKADFENMLAHLVTLSTDNGVLEDGCVYMSSTTKEDNIYRFWNLFFKPSNSEIRLGHNAKDGGDLNRTVRAVLAF